MSTELMQIDEYQLSLNKINILSNIPDNIQTKMSATLQTIMEEKSLAELYPTQLSIVNFGQSVFQDTYGVFENQYTSYRKLRQALLEINSIRSALFAAKTGQKKALIKLERIKITIEKLESELLALEPDTPEYKLKQLDIYEQKTELEEAERDSKSSANMVKDALLRITNMEPLIAKYEEECKIENFTYEESELVYLIMKLLTDAESNIRCIGSPGTGILTAIYQLPEQIRIFVVSKLQFINNIIKKEGQYCDSVIKRYYDYIKPTKKDGLIEGFNIHDFIGDFSTIGENL